MKIKFIDIIFVFIGIFIGVVLALQIRTQPVRIGSFPLDQYETQRSLLSSFSAEQEQLKESLSIIENKLYEAKKALELRTSRQTLELLDNLKKLTGFNPVKGEGIKIIINDNPNVSRVDFSATNEYFVQAPDLRDLVNILYLNEANAIAINGKRISPLTPIRSIFDSIFLENVQINPPFIIEAVGVPGSLETALFSFRERKIQMSMIRLDNLTIGPRESLRPFKYLSLNVDEESVNNN